MRSILLVFIFLFSFSKPAGAHNAQPCYLEIKAAANGWMHITWKNLITDKSGVRLKPIIGNDWLKNAPLEESVSGDYLVQEYQVHGAIPRQGGVVQIAGLEKSALAVLVKVIFEDSSTVTQLLTASRPSFILEKNNSSGYKVSGYVWLGIEHIWTGIDHLLFVFGLLLLVKSKRSLLKTITAFTIAHSITLALATLGMVHVSPAPVEAVIALSIVFLALELLRHYEGVNRLTYHYPWVVAFAFGLLHGFGFAGALSEVGLPPADVPLALLLFNIGVETGQLAFVAAVLLLGRVFRKPIAQAPPGLRKLPPYVIGSLAAYWLIERIVAVFGN